MRLLQGRTLVAVMCIAQICNLLPHVVVPAIMAHHLIPLWQLSATQAGLMASAYAFGYMLAVPVLTALSDRFDARGIYLQAPLSVDWRQLLLGCLPTVCRRRLSYGASRARASAALICRASKRSSTGFRRGIPRVASLFTRPAFQLALGYLFLFPRSYTCPLSGVTSVGCSITASARVLSLELPI